MGLQQQKRGIRQPSEVFSSCSSARFSAGRSLARKPDGGRGRAWAIGGRVDMAGRHHREAMSSRRPRWAREQAPETASSNSVLDDPPPPLRLMTRHHLSPRLGPAQSGGLTGSPRSVTQLIVIPLADPAFSGATPLPTTLVPVPRPVFCP